jgi:hypothetical protein
MSKDMGSKAKSTAARAAALRANTATAKATALAQRTARASDQYRDAPARPAVHRYASAERSAGGRSGTFERIRVADTSGTTPRPRSDPRSGGQKGRAGGGSGPPAKSKPPAGRAGGGGWGPPPSRKPGQKKKEGGKKRRPRKKLPSLVAESLPTNLAEQREAFFRSGCTIDPQFEYRVAGKTRAQKAYGTPERWLLPLAVRILDKVLAEYGSETAYLEKNFGRLLSFEEVGQEVHRYLEREGLADTVTVNYIDSAASPTSMNGDRLNIRVPCLYRAWRTEGTLAHEIGTHYTRRTNDTLQPWHGKKKRKKFRLSGFLETEEGLATLNNVLHESREPHLRPYIWQGALHYYCCCRAFELPFSQLYRELAKYVDDPDRRWRQCVRVYRGTRDTSEIGPGSCMCKDQVYLAGSVAILAARHDPACDFNLLFAGRLALDDVMQRGTMLRGAGNGATVLSPAQGLRLPPFYADDPVEYMRRLDDIAQVNGIDAWMKEQGGSSSSSAAAGGDRGGAAGGGMGGGGRRAHLVLPRLPSAGGDEDDDDDDDDDDEDDEDENDDDVEEEQELV